MKTLITGDSQSMVCMTEMDSMMRNMTKIDKDIHYYRLDLQKRNVSRDKTRLDRHENPFSGSTSRV